MMKKVLVTFKTRNDDKKIIESHLEGLAETYFIDTMEAKELMEVLPKINIILTGSGLDLTPEILANLRSIELIQTLSAGVEYVPFSELPENTIICSNAGANAIAVAEHAWALILAAAKKIIYHDTNMRKGLWKRREYGILLQGKTIGILGFGNIGRSIARIAKAFGMRILAINRSGRTDMDVDFIGTPRDIEYLLRNSDILVISLPLTKYTRGMIGENELSMMKPNAILVNISRGPIIDQKALYEHLKKNPSFVACLDVWWEYPPRGSDKAYQEYPFHELPNVIMTPHIAGFAPEIRPAVIKRAVENIVRYLRGERPKNIVRREDYV